MVLALVLLFGPVEKHASTLTSLDKGHDFAAFPADSAGSRPRSLNRDLCFNEAYTS